MSIWGDADKMRKEDIELNIWGDRGKRRKEDRVEHLE